jgi:hypothetical protein
MSFHFRRLFGVVLLAGYLLSSTPAGEVLKLPVLFEHYREHRAEMSEIGFWSYIWLHYFSGVQYDADYARDMQLPFKSISLVSVWLMALQPPLNADWRLSFPEEPVARLAVTAVQKGPSAPYIGPPAQPPEA